MGCFLPAFNPDVWPPSNPSRRGTVATGSARGLKTWLFTVSGRLWHNGLCFNACHSGVSNPSGTAATGCRLWHNGLFFTGSIRTFGRPQTLPGGVRLPLALLGASKLGPLAAGFGTMGCFLPAFTPDVWPPSNPPRQGTAATGCRLWQMGCFLPAFNPDVWPPSNPPRQGTVATGSARGLKTWQGQALAQWAVF